MYARTQTKLRGSASLEYGNKCNLGTFYVDRTIENNRKMKQNHIYRIRGPPGYASGIGVLWE